MEKFIPETRLVPVDFDPFVGAPIERTVPTTEAQREVFIASTMGEEASCAYNESVSLELIKDMLTAEYHHRRRMCWPDSRSCVSASV